MTDSIGDLLARREIPEEPKEFKIIRQFVKERFDSQVGLESHDNTLVIKVDNAPLAGALRLELHNLKTVSKTSKKLLIRIS